MNEPNVDKPQLLLVDDDKSLLRLLTIRLEGEGYQVTAVEDGQSALKKLQNDSYDVVLSDLRMPGLDGLSLFEEIMGIRKDIPVILMTAHGTIADAVSATQRGVFGFLPKPVDHDELRTLLQKALSQSQAAQPGDWAKDIITRSPDMLNVLDQAYRIAQREVSVLISGASGTGKELLANAIHKASNRNNKPFVAINCGALPENLLESELFGHAKGAFTGAVSAHPGLFREADGGTLFLDEIGDMPLNLQVKLLRVLQEKTIRPVGFHEEIPIDVRVVSATHKNLPEAINNQQFREDLYYRLNVVNLKLPPLCERREDISLLAQHFAGLIAKRMGQEQKQFANDAMHALVRYDWPGNIRQLQNVIEQVVALTPGKVIAAQLVESALNSNVSIAEPLSLNDAKKEFERDYLINTLKMSAGNVAEAAKLAKRNRSDFYKLIKKHNINVESLI